MTRKIVAILLFSAIAVFCVHSAITGYFGAYASQMERLGMYRKLKEFDAFLAQAFDNDYPVYFLNGKLPHYVPSHEAHYFTVLRLYSRKNGKLFKRAYRADSERRIDRAALLAGKGPCVVITGKSEVYPDQPDESAFLLALWAQRPGAALLRYACPELRGFEVSALVAGK